MVQTISKPRTHWWTKLWDNMKRYPLLYLMALPVILWYVIFQYGPMYGLIIAFQRYVPTKPILANQFVGLKNFADFLKDPYFFRVLRNTLTINFYLLIFAFPAAIIFALLLNELRFQKLKKLTQTITYMPYFLSWVVVAGLLNTMLSPDNGAINTLIKMSGGQPVYFLTSKQWFRPILILSEIWKNIGYGSIVYLAAITSIDQEQYEAARVDGANKLQQIIHITLPALSEIIAIMLILQIGKMFDDNFDQIFNLYSPSVYDVSDVFETYVYRNGIQQSKFSYSAAVGLVKSVLALVMILFSNRASRKLGAQGLF